MEKFDKLQAKLTLLAVMAGLGCLVIIFLATLWAFKDLEQPAETIVAVMGSATTVLGTLVGYMAGQSGRHTAEKRAESAEQRASQSEQKITAVVDSTGGGVLEKAKKAYPELFSDAKDSKHN